MGWSAGLQSIIFGSIFAGLSVALALFACGTEAYNLYLGSGIYANYGLWKACVEQGGVSICEKIDLSAVSGTSYAKELKAARAFFVLEYIVGFVFLATFLACLNIRAAILPLINFVLSLIHWVFLTLASVLFMLAYRDLADEGTYDYQVYLPFAGLSCASLAMSFAARLVNNPL